MKINVEGLARNLVGGKIDFAKAISIIQQVLFLIDLAEDALQEVKGDQKLQAVLATVNSWLKLIFPDEVETVWANVKDRLPSIISFVVTVKNLLGMWPQNRGVPKA